MAAHSRPNDGVASLAYVAGIHVFLPLTKSKTWMAGPSPRRRLIWQGLLKEATAPQGDKPGHDKSRAIIPLG
jgi:hypothetical protein